MLNVTNLVTLFGEVFPDVRYTILTQLYWPTLRVRVVRLVARIVLSAGCKVSTE
jgi:hypothetical protein